MTASPVERHGDLWVKRDDLFVSAGRCGGKVRTCARLAERAAVGVVTAGSRSSPQVEIVASVAAALGLRCRCHIPTGPATAQTAAAEEAGATIVRHRAGYNNVIIARAREDAALRGWTEIPFGMECAEAVEATAGQVANVAPLPWRRLVVPVGSGMSLAGILAGLAAAGDDRPVLGVVVGASPARRLDRWARGWRRRPGVELVEAGIDYHRAAPETALPSGLELDPIYEAKCLPWLLPGDLFWIVGRRGSV